jgi:hypothetical protein
VVHAIKKHQPGIIQSNRTRSWVLQPNTKVNKLFPSHDPPHIAITTRITQTQQSIIQILQILQGIAIRPPLPLSRLIESLKRLPFLFDTLQQIQYLRTLYRRNSQRIVSSLSPRVSNRTWLESRLVKSFRAIYLVTDKVGEGLEGLSAEVEGCVVALGTGAHGFGGVSITDALVEEAVERQTRR